jgi:peptide/nickel transport system permease protein
MLSAAKAVPAPQKDRPKHSELRTIIRIFFRRKLAVVGMVIIVIMVFIAILAPLLAPYDPYKTDVVHKLAPPSLAHWLGTDVVGRDTLSRIIYASRTSLLVGICAVGLSAVIGQIMGLLAAFYGGWVFNIIMRLTDALMAVPMLILALTIASVLGGGLKNVIIALGVGGIAGYCRMMCAQAMSIKENDYILAAETINVTDVRMMMRHIFPNAFSPILVMMTIGLGRVILAEAGLSFLGIGINPPEAAWGSMISDGYRFLLTNPVLSFAPGFFIMLVVFGFNMFGDGLRDALDPRLRGTV